MVDVKCLSDCELQNQLEKLGFSPGPILPSTRKVYEKKLVRLLVSPPCASPVMDRPGKPNGPQDSDDSEEFNVILKGNITLSKEKSKESKKNPVFEIQEEEESVKPNSDHKTFKMLVKIPKAAATKIRAGDFCLSSQVSEGIRWATRAPKGRLKHGIVTRSRHCCALNQGYECGLPVGLKLAVLGIFIIVVFVYITVEKDPFFG